jgi:peptidoglycan hydrolase-like protein with peptidoglycan-binding domain
MTRILFQRPSSGYRSVRGELIKKVQKSLGNLYTDIDIIDGIYGRNTEIALLNYQQQHNLSPTGKIDEEIWKQLVSPQLPSIQERCLQITADFEGHGFTKIAGNFDGAGLTWGIIGFTLAHGELEKIIEEINNRYPSLLQQAFGSQTNELLIILDKPLSEQMAWANRISLGRNKEKVKEPWNTAFDKLGNYPEVQAIQIEHTQEYWDIAFRDVQRFNLRTELGLALCFEIAVQNGGIDRTERDRIQRKITQTQPSTEQDVRIIIANVVAENSKPIYIEDVRSRKLTIATTRGTVHGGKYEIKTWGLDEIPWQ